MPHHRAHAIGARTPNAAVATTTPLASCSCGVRAEVCDPPHLRGRRRRTCAIAWRLRAPDAIARRSRPTPTAATCVRLLSNAACRLECPRRPRRCILLGHCELWNPIVRLGTRAQHRSQLALTFEAVVAIHWASSCRLRPNSARFGQVCAFRLSDFGPASGICPVLGQRCTISTKLVPIWAKFGAASAKIVRSHRCRTCLAAALT